MSDLQSRLDGVVHAETQVHDQGVDLTVAAIYTVATPGRIDFGGSELESADLSPVPTGYRHPDDDYEWWNLDAGTYLLAFNEALDGDDPVVLQPRQALREQGAYHPTLHVTDLRRVPLTVATGGVCIKENARVSTLRQP